MACRLTSYSGSQQYSNPRGLCCYSTSRFYFSWIFDWITRYFLVPIERKVEEASKCYIRQNDITFSLSISNTHSLSFSHTHLLLNTHMNYLKPSSNNAVQTTKSQFHQKEEEWIRPYKQRKTDKHRHTERRDETRMTYRAVPSVFPSFNQKSFILPVSLLGRHYQVAFISTRSLSSSLLHTHFHHHDL